MLQSSSLVIFQGIFSFSFSFLLLLLLSSSLLVVASPIHRGRQADARLTEVDWVNYSYREPEGRGSYAFGYDIDDAGTDNVQFRHEERHANGTVAGSYGYLQPDGNVQLVEYVADENGYRANVRILRQGGGLLKPVLVNEDTVHEDITNELASFADQPISSNNNAGTDSSKSSVSPTRNPSDFSINGLMETLPTHSSISRQEYSNYNNNRQTQQHRQIQQQRQLQQPRQMKRRQQQTYQNRDHVYNNAYQAYAPFQLS